MSDFDKTLKELLSAEDEAYLAENLREKDFYSEVWGSLKGPGKGLYIMTWAGIMIMLNSAQIALKLWFNMRLNRQAIVTDIKRLQLAVSRMTS